MGFSSNFIFIQYTDPKYTALNSKLWLLYNTLKLLKTSLQSPDVNPMQYLWKELDRRIRRKNNTNKRYLKQHLEEEWYKIDSDYTKKLVRNLPSRLKAIIQSKGYPVQYLVIIVTVIICLTQKKAEYFFAEYFFMFYGIIHLCYFFENASEVHHCP